MPRMVATIAVRSARIGTAVAMQVSLHLLWSAIVLLGLVTLGLALFVYFLMELHYRQQLARQARRLMLSAKVSGSPDRETLRALWLRAGRADRDILAEVLIDQCGFPGETRRNTIQQALIGAGILESWVEALRSRRRSRRVQAAAWLGHVRDVRSLQALVEAAGDPAVEVRLAVTLSLGRLKDPRGLPGLVRLASNPPPAIPDLTLAAALAACAEGRADRLVSLLRLPGTRSRIIGAWALSAVADHTALRQLLAATHDPEPEVRAKVVRALSRIPAPESERGILCLTRDPVWFVRLRAFTALGELHAAVGGAAALEGLVDDVREVRYRAAGTLRRIRGMTSETVREVLATRPRLSFDSLVSEWERAGFLWEVVAGLSTRQYARFIESRELLRVLIAAGVTSALMHFVLVYPQIKVRLRLLRLLAEAGTPAIRAELLALAGRPGIDARVAAKIRQVIPTASAAASAADQHSSR